ncbi:hypothetical protein [Acinetobacter sp. P1(2025)]|uniref:hypothetical protein n=1 Tax=Acinetobacter sp. P1(2025) TaxID=3446120 RepID=UPI003F52AA93
MESIYNLEEMQAVVAKVDALLLERTNIHGSIASLKQEYNEAVDALVRKHNEAVDVLKIQYNKGIDELTKKQDECWHKMMMFRKLPIYAEHLRIKKAKAEADEKMRMETLRVEREKAEQNRLEVLRVEKEKAEKELADFLGKYKATFDEWEINAHNLSEDDRKLMLHVVKSVSNKMLINKEHLIVMQASSKLRGYLNTDIGKRIHINNANFYRNRFKKTGSFWDAVNACSSLRKANESKTAINVLQGSGVIAKARTEKNTRFMSAYYTTLGGANRDIEEYDSAVKCAEKAHRFDEKNYRPCTLLGAVYMDLAQYNLGDEWYKKALKRGAPENSINAEVKAVVLKLKGKNRNDVIDQLIKKDRLSYSWLVDFYI